MVQFLNVIPIRFSTSALKDINIAHKESLLRDLITDCVRLNSLRRAKTERMGFEPMVGFPTHALQACALDRSATFPLFYSSIVANSFIEDNLNFSLKAPLSRGFLFYLRHCALRPRKSALTYRPFPYRPSRVRPDTLRRPSFLSFPEYQ